jgi:hypothetical protein
VNTILATVTIPGDIRGRYWLVDGSVGTHAETGKTKLDEYEETSSEELGICLDTSTSITSMDVGLGADLDNCNVALVPISTAV